MLLNWHNWLWVAYSVLLVKRYEKFIEI